VIKHRFMIFILLIAICLPAQARAASSSNTEGVSQIIAQHLLAQESSFSLELKDTKVFRQMDAIFKTALKSNDYIHYVVKGYSYTAKQTKSNGMSFNFKITYLENKTQTAYVTSQVKKILAQIIQPDMNVYQKEKAIHDYIVSHIAYDTSLVNYSAYAALTKGKTVCQGFALLTYRMLEEVGITNRIVEGYAGGKPHAWNEVNLEGKWYQLDTTWDNPVPFVKGRVLYTYFNVTSAELQKDHMWTKSHYPEATTSFQDELLTKITNDPLHAKTYQDLQKALGYQKNTAKLVVISSVQELQKQIEAGMSNKKTHLTLHYKLASRNLVKDLQTAVANKSKFSVKQIEYTSTKGSNGVITLDLYVKLMLSLYIIRTPLFVI
jgi:transglutaminase/protease-like cytokinesis protein 3